MRKVAARDVGNDGREIKNAKIVAARLEIEDHGMLTAFLMLDYGSSGQGFGGYCFDTGPGQDGSGFAGWFLFNVLKTLGVDRWEDLPGTSCRVEAGWSKVYRIGHFIEEKWFDPSAWPPKEQP